MPSQGNDSRALLRARDVDMPFVAFAIECHLSSEGTGSKSISSKSSICSSASIGSRWGCSMRSSNLDCAISFVKVCDDDAKGLELFIVPLVLCVKIVSAGKEDRPFHDRHRSVFATKCQIVNPTNYPPDSYELNPFIFLNRSSRCPRSTRKHLPSRRIATPIASSSFKICLMKSISSISA